MITFQNLKNTQGLQEYIYSKTIDFFSVQGYISKAVISINEKDNSVSR